jgi:hypothetical protein
MAGGDRLVHGACPDRAKRVTFFVQYAPDIDIVNVEIDFIDS